MLAVDTTLETEINGAWIIILSVDSFHQTDKVEQSYLYPALFIPAIRNESPKNTEPGQHVLKFHPPDPPSPNEPTPRHSSVRNLHSSALFMSFIPKSSCKLVAPTVEALSWEPSRCVLPFLASREALVLSTVTWDEVLDGWLFTWEVEGWEAWLSASWRLLEEKGEGEEVRRGGGQSGRGTVDVTVHRHREWAANYKHDGGISGGTTNTQMPRWRNWYIYTFQMFLTILW